MVEIADCFQCDLEQVRMIKERQDARLQCVEFDIYMKKPLGKLEASEKYLLRLNGQNTFPNVYLISFDNHVYGLSLSELRKKVSLCPLRS